MHTHPTPCAGNRWEMHLAPDVPLDLTVDIDIDTTIGEIDLEAAP